MPDLPTIVISTLYHDFFAAIRVAKMNRKQLQRLASIGALIQGVSITALVYKNWGLAACLWIAAAVKSVLCVLILVWSAETVTSV